LPAGGGDRAGVMVRGFDARVRTEALHAVAGSRDVPWRLFLCTALLCGGAVGRPAAGAGGVDRGPPSRAACASARPG
jgi:hypothetical protein